MFYCFNACELDYFLPADKMYFCHVKCPCESFRKTEHPRFKSVVQHLTDHQNLLVRFSKLQALGLTVEHLNPIMVRPKDL